MTPESAKKIYLNIMTYWWLYGIIGAAIYILTFWIFIGNSMVIKDITMAGAIGFLQGGVLTRWMARYQLGELERKNQNEDKNI